MVNIENVVGAGSLEVELNLSRLAEDISAPHSEYDPENYPGLYLRWSEDGPLITLYRTGKYNITGASSDNELYEARDQLLKVLHDLGIHEPGEGSNFAINNYVCTADLGQQVDLNALAIYFGLENTEYEPEQFPALVYRPPDYSCVFLIFSTGKVVITGVPNTELAENAFQDLQNQIRDVS